MRKDTRAGEAMFNAALETLRLTTVPMCAKCFRRSEMGRLQKYLDMVSELVDRLGLPAVKHGWVKP